MSAVQVVKGAPTEKVLGTTLTRLIPGDGVRQIQVSSPDGAVYVVFDNSLDDGAAVPATARQRLPAGVWPVNFDGTRILIAGVAGATPTVSLLGGASGAFGAGVGAGGSGGVTLGQVIGLQRNLF